MGSCITAVITLHKRPVFGLVRGCVIKPCTSIYISPFPLYFILYRLDSIHCIAAPNQVVFTTLILLNPIVISPVHSCISIISINSIRSINSTSSYDIQTASTITELALFSYCNSTDSLIYKPTFNSVRILYSFFN